MPFNKIANSITELLYKHHCVIIPGLGGLITNHKAAGFDDTKTYFSPATHKVVFNKNLQQNDGLLVNHWAQVNQITYQQAQEDVLHFSQHVISKLDSQKRFELADIGTLYKNEEGNLIFVPLANHNFLDASFGLSPIKVVPVLINRDNKSTIKEGQLQEKLESVETSETNLTLPKKKRNSLMPYYRIAASLLLIALALGGSKWLISDKTSTSQSTSSPSQQEAGIFNNQTSENKSLYKTQKSVNNLSYTAEKEKLKAIKAQINNLPSTYESTTTKFDVVIGNYKSENQAQIDLNRLGSNYSDAHIISNDGNFKIVVETFYKHTSADTFCVMLQQSGFKNCSVEEQSN